MAPSVAADTVRQWELLHFGLDALCQFNRSEMSDFFETFFALDDSQWRDFLAGTATPRRWPSQ